MNLNSRFLLPLNIIRRQYVEYFLWKKKDYEKFIIISHARSGSTFFKTLLNSHPELLCYGELFYPVPQKHFFRPELFPFNSSESSEQLEKMRRNNSIKFLEKYIWRKHKKKHKAVGFKIFYYHARESDWKSVWDYIQKDQSIKIIHLHRENRLNTFLSLEKARRSNVWHGSGVDQSPITLDPQKCKAFFEQFENFELEFDQKFPNHKNFKIYYESLAKNRDEQLNKICAFLNVRPIKLKSKMEKIQKRSISESISNFSELELYFKSTKWNKFFK
jgi:LPS sulfotransferase NodH